MSLKRVALAGVIVVLAFWRAFGLWRFYDDWTFVSEATRALRSDSAALFIWSSIGQHWSPVWQAFEAFNAWLVGWRSDWLIRGVTVLMALAGLILCGRVASRLGLSPAAAATAMAILGLHHINAAAYYSFDTYSQVAADLCAWTIATLVIALERERDVGLVLALYAVSLLIKEQALSALTVAGAVALERRRPVVWLTWSGMLALSVAFATGRYAAGVLFYSSGPFSLCLACVPGNAAVMLGGLLLPTRTMNAYLAFLDPSAHGPALVTAAVGTAFVALALLLGLRLWWRTNGNRRQLLLVAALMVASLFPTVLLFHVGELYPHTALFWFAILTGYAVDGWRARLAGRPALPRQSIAAVIVAYVAILFVGLRANLADMRATGERARALQLAFNEAVRDIPRGVIVIVHGLNPVRASTDYSLYRLTTPGMLLVDSVALRFTSDPTLTIVDEADWPAQKARFRGSRVVLASFDEGRVSLEWIPVDRS